MKTLETKSERIATRVTPMQKSLISQAASLRGRSLTEFIIDSAQKEAEKVIKDGSIIYLSVENQINLIEILANPPEANKALKKAFKDYDNYPITSK